MKNKQVTLLGIQRIIFDFDNNGVTIFEELV